MHGNGILPLQNDHGFLLASLSCFLLDTSPWEKSPAMQEGSSVRKTMWVKMET